MKVLNLKHLEGEDIKIIKVKLSNRGHKRPIGLIIEYDGEEGVIEPSLSGVDLKLYKEGQIKTRSGSCG